MHPVKTMTSNAGWERTGKRSALRRGVRRCFQYDVSSVDYDFPGIFKIHRDQVRGYGLDLANPPVRLGRIDHEFAGFQKSVQDMHCRRPTDQPRCRLPCVAFRLPSN